jgi:hypothetical protein
MDRIWAEAFPGGQPNMQHPLLTGTNSQAAAMIHALGPETALPLLARSRLQGDQWEFKTAEGQAFLFNPRTRETIQVPGTGQRPPEAVRTSAVKINRAANNIVPALTAFERLVRNSGWTFGNNAERDAVVQARADLIVQLKELYDLGALQEPDMRIMNQLLIETDPGFWSNNPLFGGNPAGRIGPAMQRLRQTVERARRNALAAANMQPQQQQQQQQDGTQRLRYDPASGELVNAN